MIWVYAFFFYSLTKLKQRHEQMLDRKGFVLNEKFSIDEKLSKFEKLMENEQKYQIKLNNQYKNLTEHLFSLNNELLLIRKREKQYEIDNQSYQNQMHNIKNQINKLDQQLLKQQELIYHHEFIKQTIDRRLNRISGEKNNEKYSESDLKIRELKIECETKKTQYDQLQNQIKILNEELRIIKRDLNQLTDEKNDLNDKFLQFDLYITLSEKMIKKLNTEKEVKNYFFLIN
jgi:chromosome segregation ATPase